jgi:hypothetical protein
MKSLLGNFTICGGVALFSAVGISLLLTLGARLPRIGPVPLAAACERANTLALGISVFVLVSTIGIMCMVLRELRRRAFKDLGQRTGTKKVTAAKSRVNEKSE